jgi:hypothetical protein
LKRTHRLLRTTIESRKGHGIEHGPSPRGLAVSRQGLSPRTNVPVELFRISNYHFCSRVRGRQRRSRSVDTRPFQDGTLSFYATVVDKRGILITKSAVEQAAINASRVSLSPQSLQI